MVKKRRRQLAGRTFFSEDERFREMSFPSDENILPLINESVSWEEFRPILRQIYQGDGSKGGRPPFDEVLMFKTLFLQVFFDIPCSRIEFAVKDRASFMVFIGVENIRDVPAGRTLCGFRDKLENAGLIEPLFEKLQASFDWEKLVLTHGRNERKLPEKLHTPDIMETVNGFRNSSILMAACELDLFTVLLQNGNSMTPPELAESAECDPAAVLTLTGALVSIGFLRFRSGKFSVPPEYAESLDSRSPKTMVPLICHWAGCQRNWSQLAWAVKTGYPAPRQAGVLGPLGDFRAFVLAMDVIARSKAGPIARKLKDAGLLEFKEMLDLGGASGSYTYAFLEINPDGRGTIYDRAIALQEARVKSAGTPYAERVSFMEGDFNKDELPAEKFDFVWVSAIIHSLRDSQTAALFCRIFKTLVTGGRLAIRDVYVNSDRTGPPAAALFGVNMLAGTPYGKVYTEEEVFALLADAGFSNPAVVIPTDDMGAVIAAEK